MFSPSPAGRLVRQPPIGVVRRRRQALLSWGSPAAETPAIAPVPLRFALWIGIGVASGLVLLSGGWVVVQMRK